jgi:hypothetical protein
VDKLSERTPSSASLGLRDCVFSTFRLVGRPPVYRLETRLDLEAQKGLSGRNRLRPAPSGGSKDPPAHPRRAQLPADVRHEDCLEARPRGCRFRPARFRGPTPESPIPHDREATRLRLVLRDLAGSQRSPGSDRPRIERSADASWRERSDRALPASDLRQRLSLPVKTGVRA